MNQYTSVAQLVKIFWSKVRIVPLHPNACWEWQGTLDSHGYGQYQIKRVRTLVHRLSYQWATGTDISGLCVLHICDNPICVNPAHLWLGTREDNNADRQAKGRSYRPTSNSANRGKLTVEDIINIRLYNTDGIGYGTLAKKYGVSKSTIYDICKYRSRKNVQG